MTKYLKFKQRTDKKDNKLNEHAVMTNKNDFLGDLSEGDIFKKRMVFTTEDDVEWTSECLRQIVDKLEDLENNQKVLGMIKKDKEWLRPELDKLNNAIKAVMKLSPEMSVVLGVEEFGEMISELETSKVELCKRMGISYKSKWKLKERKKFGEEI